MPAATWHIKIEQGATFRSTLTVTALGSPLNLTGYSAAMQVRATPEDPVVLLELTSTPGGGITIDGPAGQLTLHVEDEVTALLTWTHAAYDLLLTAPSGDVTRLVEGAVDVDPGVTR